MSKSLVIGALLLALAIPAYAQSPHPLSRPVTAVPEGGSPGGIYGGGPHTLPYGVMSGQLVLEHAHLMVFLQTAIDEMLRRGYIRRMDLDLAATEDNYSCAVIAFQKPGRPVDQEEPILLVVTKPYNLPDGGIIPVTQVTGGIVCDSAGVLVTRTSAADSALALVGLVSELSQSPGLVQSVNSDDLEFRYSAHEARPWSGFQNHMSPGMQCTWKNWGQRMGVAAGTGIVSGMVGAFSSGQFAWQSVAARATVGAAIAVWTANELFWISPPDTSGCQ